MAAFGQAAAAYGVVCRLLWWSSLAFDSRPRLTIELATPANGAPPHGLALCFTDAGWAQRAADVSVVSLASGGSMWQPGSARELVGGGGGDWRAAPFFAQAPAAARQLLPVEAGDMSTVLGGDPYFAGPDGYDGLLTDQEGTPLPDDLFTLTASGDAGGGRPAAGHCLIVSGAWQVATRYLLTLELAAPRPPEGRPLRPPPKPPGLWMAPLVYSPPPAAGGGGGGGGARAGAVRMAVRGSKLGQLCTLRPQAAALLPGMFSACAEAMGQRLLPAEGAANTAECVAALQAAHEANASLADTFPFNAPPVAAGLGPSSPPPAAACPPGWQLSPQLGGECVDCSNAAVVGARCRCFPGFAPHVAGAKACGPAIRPAGNASSAKELGDQLCREYSGHLEKMMQGELGDRLVLAVYLEAFARQAAFLVDWAAVDEANATLWARHVEDRRVPSSPSRQRSGVAPNCTACSGGGLFTDIYTGQRVPARDDRFRAVQTFRLVGLLLAGAGQPCPALWDPGDPLRWMYGKYERALCTAF